MFYRFVSVLSMLVFCLFASAMAFAGEASDQLITDPTTMIAAAAYVLLEFVLGKTSLIKSGSLLELGLRAVGRLAVKAFGLEKHGYKLKD